MESEVSAKHGHPDEAPQEMPRVWMSSGTRGEHMMALVALLESEIRRQDAYEDSVTHDVGVQGEVISATAECYKGFGSEHDSRLCLLIYIAGYCLRVAKTLDERVIQQACTAAHTRELENGKNSS